MENKDRFIMIYKKMITREGGDKLLEYLEKSDFFTAPASTRFHGSYPGGLVEHSLNVYDCLKDYMERPRVNELYKVESTEESIAIVALLHDLCKVNCYKLGSRNVKGADGVWQQVPTYDYLDNLPYGHGEKSVYIINGFLRLSRDEAFAIRFHMGFSGIEDKRMISDAMEKFPLTLALVTADMEATFFLEKNKK